ncbi:hypothetical protein AMEX_G7732 [Astyanax mexicanus]|uniref:Uncharacterized protein n=1 Tax=Astyanax mexicanus TaxID=7994 RepID=A0A8T2M9Y8_ASTMX|nr:hypothetical protein AMEX_G7732 [Astyanax mexicanus]
MDSESPDFVPSVFVYKKHSQRPEGKIERPSRKRKRDERETVTQPAPPPPPVDDTCTVEETAEAMVPQKDYEDLVTKHGQLQEECVSLLKECEQLRDENAKLKEKLKNAHFTCSTVKPDLTQFVFLTGLTTVIFDWLLGKLKLSFLSDGQREEAYSAVAELAESLTDRSALEKSDMVVDAGPTVPRHKDTVMAMLLASDEDEEDQAEDENSEMKAYTKDFDQ